MDMLDFRVEGKKVIGLSGNIGSGKTSTLMAFKLAGAEVICADTLSSKYYEIFKEKIHQTFGTADKQKIAEDVFKNPQKRKQLENILHPLVLKEGREIIEKSKNNFIVFDIPLLFEKGLEGCFDLTICVCTSYQKRLKRVLERGLSKTSFEARDKAQLPVAQKAERADIVIFNEGTQKNLQGKVARLYNFLKNKK